MVRHTREAPGSTAGHGGVLPLHRDVQQRSTCGTPLYCSREPNAHRHVVPPLGGADGLVSDVAVDLAGELLIAQAQRHDVGGDVVQQLRRGHTLQVLWVDGEALHHRVTHCRSLLADDLAEAGQRVRLLIPPEGVLEERRQQPRTKQRPTQLSQRQGVQPLPLTQPHRRQPSVEHHEEDAGQRQGDSQQGGFEPTEAVVGRGDVVGHYIIDFSIFIIRIKYTGT